MTRKDYVVIADGMVQLWYEMFLPRIEMSRAIEAMARVLGHHNDNFNKKMFIEYINKRIDDIQMKDVPF